MVVICPTCDKAIPCDDDATCVETVPDHGNCKGGLGFVLPNTEKELTIKVRPDPRFRK